MQSEIVQQKISEKQTDPQIKFWISLLMTSLANDDTSRENWTKFSADIANSLLTENAKYMLKHSQYQQSLQDFLQEESGYHWKCKTCSASAAINDKSFTYLDILQCQNGHNWPRCCKTMQICDNYKLCQCSWCGAIALPEFALSNCPLCSGTLNIV